MGSYFCASPKLGGGVKKGTKMWLGVRTFLLTIERG